MKEWASTIEGTLSRVLLAPGVFLAAHYSGLSAVAWVMLANLTCSLFVLSYLATTHAGVSLMSQWRAVRPVLLFFDMLKRIDSFSDAIASLLTISSLPAIIILAAFAITFRGGSRDADADSGKYPRHF